MLAFVTSIRAKALADDWEHHVRLLARSLTSFLGQSQPDVRVVVVCHDVPRLPQLDDPRVHVIEADIPLPSRVHADLVRDKVIKVSLGARWAIDAGCRFVMFADADDLVSRRLNAQTLLHPSANGWYFDAGYVHQYGQRFFLRSREHHLLCGTCAIFRSDLLRFERRADYRDAVVSRVAAEGHAEFVREMRDAGTPLAALPFPGSVYIQHPHSLATMTFQQAGARAWWKAGLGRVRDGLRQAQRLRILTPRLAGEFSLLPGVP
jgi:hypothetical protein